ncbi:MAG: site-2 protease family protein [Phycisphaerales bacterium]|nr:site-2 protease family protein [Phycisphaerales bacterium]
MIWSLLTQEPMLAVAWLAVILISLTVHEFSHALAGKWLGDTTAEREGRLTLNPAAHIDPVGFLMLLFIGFGWAKPVPFSPFALKHPVRDSVLIALAGPASNVALALVSGGLFATLVTTGVVSMTSLLAVFLVLLIYMNGVLAVFNIIPIPPLDGSKLLDAFFALTRQRALAELFAKFGPVVLIALVLMSSGAGIRVFSFISLPVAYFCSVIIGSTCTEVFLTALGG